MNIRIIIREEINKSDDDMKWIRDVQPSILDILHIATKDNPNINVIFDSYSGNEFMHIEDVEGQNYFSKIEIIDWFDIERIGDLSKGDLLNFMKNLLNGSWEFDNTDEDNQDYKDYMELYRVIETL